MSRVSTYDLTKYNFKVLSLGIAGITARNISAKINNIIYYSNEALAGESFNALRRHLRLYAEAYNDINELTILLTNNMKSVNNRMLNFMYGYTEIDDSKLGEIETEIVRIKNEIETCEYWKKDSLRSILDIMKQIKEKIEELKPTDNALAKDFRPITNDIHNLKVAIENIRPIDRSAIK